MLMNLDSLPGVPKQGSDSEGSESETTEVAAVTMKLKMQQVERLSLKLS